MSTVIKLKYSTVTAQPADDSLNISEPAYSFVNGGKLWIGAEGTGASAGTVVPQVIGGKYFTDMLDHTPGLLTAGSAIITNSESKISELNVDNITLDNNTISITETDGNLTLSANGSGSIIFSSPISTSSDVDFGNISISGNTISATNTNGNIDLTPDGTGLVRTLTDQGLLIPKGTEGTRPSAAGIPAGVIRYNETSNRFEGTVSGAWTGLGGVVDIDQDTYISAEANSDEDKLRFYTAGTQRLVLDDTALASSVEVTAPKATIDNVIIDGSEIVINGSYISATGNTSAGTIILDPAPAAGDAGGDLVVRGNLQVTGTTTTVNSTVVEIADPVLQLGTDTVVDSLDRGVEAIYGIDDGEGGVTAKSAFFGWSRIGDNFTFSIDGFVSDAKFKDLKLDGSIVSVDGVAPTAGQLLIGNGTNGDMELATLTAGDSITITNTDGGIELDVNAATAVSTTDIHDTGDGVTDYTPTADNASARGAATFASEQFSVSSGHVVITEIDGGTF